MENTEKKTFSESLKKFWGKFKTGANRYFTKKAIYIKNHLHVIPLAVTAISTIILTCTIFIFNDAINYLPYDNINAFLFFVNVMASIMGTVSYLMATGKHVTKKKKILMLVLFYVFMIGQIVLDTNYIISVTRQISEHDDLIIDSERWFVPLSQTWALVHIIIVSFAIALSIAAPFLQPITKRIQLGVGTKKNKVEVEKVEDAQETTSVKESDEKRE